MEVFNVSVHILEPGFFRTNIVENIDKGRKMLYDRCPDDIKEEYGEEYLEECESRKCNCYVLIVMTLIL